MKRIAVVIALAATLIAGVMALSRPATTMSDYDSALARWNAAGITDYDIVVLRDCLTCLGNGTFTVHVEDSVPVGGSSDAPDMDDLLYWAKKLIKDGPKCTNMPGTVDWQVNISFNKQYGYPELVERKGSGSRECGSPFTYRVLSFTPSAHE